MDSIDRATLIDFALGRLNEAEAAAFVNRAERDSEFAQTLAALRRELAALDDVRPSALRALPRRSSPPVAQTHDAPEAPLSADANDEGRVVFLDALNPNAVKVRRVGPAYPYYADENGENAQATQVDEDAVFDENEKNGENKENAQATQVGEDEAFGENEQSGENKENAQATQVGEDETFGENEQSGENKENAQATQVGEDEAFGENEQSGENKENAQATRVGEDEAFGENEQSGENKENAQATQVGEDETFGENEQSGENKENAQATQVGEDEAFGENEQSGENADVRSTPSHRRRRFIPKFIATPRASRPSTFVAKRARFLDDASLVNDGSSNAASLSQAAEFCDAANAESTQNNDFGSADVLEQAVVSAPNFNISNEIPAEATQNIPTDNALQENERPLDDARDLAVENAENADYRADQEKNVADFDVFNEERRDETENVPFGDAFPQVDLARSVAERRLVELLGREPTQNEKEEYYWETLDEDPRDEISPKKRRSSLGAPIRFATETTIAIGRTTLALCGIERQAGLGSDAFAATKARRKRQPGKISDTMISTVSGFLIAVVVVWPLIRLVARDVLSTIAMSAVRKIGVGVPISENAPQSDVFPLISEHIVFPRYESGALQPLDDATLQETGARSETFAPVASSGVDPASTAPTLESPDVDETNDAPLAGETSPRVPRR